MKLAVVNIRGEFICVSEKKLKLTNLKWIMKYVERQSLHLNTHGHALGEIKFARNSGLFHG